MLEPPQEPTPKEPEANADDGSYYIPPMRSEPLSGRGKAPIPKRFNRKMLMVLALIGGIIVVLAFAVGLQPPKLKAPQVAADAAKAPMPAADVNSLAGSYEGIELGEPRPGDAGVVTLPDPEHGMSSSGQPRQLTPVEQYRAQQALDQLRDEDRARSAPIMFANAAGGESTAAQGVSVANPDPLQEKLLDLVQNGGLPKANPTGANVSARDDANRQDDKLEFEERNRGDDFALHAHLVPPRSPYTLFAGTILPCVLMQGIDSDLPGAIGCLISQNVYDTVTGQHLLIPQGTKALGTYDSRIAYGQDRVLVVWTRLLRPDGSTLSLEGMPGVDLSGYAGLTGHVNNHYGRLAAGVVLGSILGASAQVAVGANSQNPSFAALAMQGAGQNMNEAGQQITRKNLNLQPTIEVRPGSRLNIFATKDLVLPPWAG